MFFPGFDLAPTAGLALGRWGWFAAFHIAKDLGALGRTQYADRLKFSIECLPEKRRRWKVKVGVIGGGVVAVVVGLWLRA